MKTTKLFLSTCFIALSYFANAQEYAVDKGATIISGTVGFSSQGGDLYAYHGKRLNTFIFTPSFNYFVAKNFFIGGSLEFTEQSQDGANINSLAIGPQLGAVAGNINSSAFPYFSVGLRYYRQEYDFGSSYFGNETVSGTDIVLSAGVIASLKKHLGMSFEAVYHTLSLKPSGGFGISVSGNVFSLGIGINGLLFKEAASKPTPAK